MRNKQRMSQAQAAQNAQAIAAARAAVGVGANQATMTNSGLSPITTGRQLNRGSSKQDTHKMSSSSTILSKSPNNIVRHARAGATIRNRSSSKTSQQQVQNLRSHSDLIHQQTKHQLTEPNSTDVPHSQQSRRVQQHKTLNYAAMPSKIHKEEDQVAKTTSTILPMRRSRVKSMQQASVQPLFMNSLARKPQQRELKLNRKESGRIPNSASLGRLLTTSGANAIRSMANDSSVAAQTMLDYTQTSLWQARTLTAQETHIRLLVRVRPVLSSETASQCIQLVQKRTDGVDFGHSVSQSSNSATKKRLGGLLKASKSTTEPRAAEMQASMDQMSSANNSSVIKLIKGYNSISFKFDQVLDEGCSQESSFQLSSADIVKSFVSIGSSATIFAYGQTGTGKTHTIIGGGSQTGSAKRTKKLKLSSSESKGILPRIIDKLFVLGSADDTQYIMSFFEIYNDKVYDLLKTPTFSPKTSGSAGSKDSQSSRESLDVREQKDGNFVVHNLKKVVVNTRQESYIWLERGLQNRQISATSANAASSRSHTIFQIEKVNHAGGQTSKLRIVDLAGSEKYCYSNMSQDLKMNELSSINQSLSTLGQCISALGDPQRRHIPFRNCKLTKILRDSLMQPIDSPLPTLVAVIVCISPSVDSYQETQSTLQFANRAKKAILNQAEAQQPVAKQSAADQTGSLSKLKSAQQDMDNMATEMEKLRKENQKLKSHLRDIRQSNSQSSFRGSSIQGATTPILGMLASAESFGKASIDLRLSQVFQDERIATTSHFEERSARQASRPRQESSPQPVLEMSIYQQPQIQLRSCFKGQRAHKDVVQHKKTMASHVVFHQQLDNDTSLNESIKDRIEHNLRYNDDTIFDNLSIFADVGNTNKKVEGAKDKFNAKSLLSTPVWEIQVSDEDEEQDQGQPNKNYGAANSGVFQPPEETKEPKVFKPILEVFKPTLEIYKPTLEVFKPILEQKTQQSESPPQKQPQRHPSTNVEMQENDNNVSQLPSFSQSNIQGGASGTSFLPDMASLPQIQQDTLNLSNDLSNDLIDMANDKMFQDAFTKGGLSLMHRGDPGSAIKPSPAFKDSSPIARPSNLRDQKIVIRDDDEFLKFDEGLRQDESLPLSASLAFGDQPGSNLSTLLEQSNQQAQRPHHRYADAHQEMFTQHEKLFLNDMSNIMQVEEQMTSKSIDTGPNKLISQAFENQLQSTLILDAEDDYRHQAVDKSSSHNDIGIGLIERKTSSQSSPLEDTIAGFAMLGGNNSNSQDGSDDIKCSGIMRRENRAGKDYSGEQDRMISFDASRISANQNVGLNLDTSQANMNSTMLRHLNNNDDEHKYKNRPPVEGDLTNPMEEYLIKPELIEHSAPMNLMSDVHTGSLFGRNYKKLAMPALAENEKPDAMQKIEADEILTQSLTNTFSTIQSLGGELSALRNNLEFSHKIQSNQQEQQRDQQQQNLRVQRHTRPLRASGYQYSGNQEEIKQAKPTAGKVQSVQVAPSTKKQFSSSVPDLSSVQPPQSQQQSVSTTPQILPHDMVQARQELIKGQHYTRPFNTMGSHSAIVPGNRIEKIHESQYDDEIFEQIEEDQNTSDDYGVNTDQSLSLDLTLVTRNLQGYYSQIHSEVAQLKETLLQSQHDQQLARSARGEDSNVFSNQELPQFAAQCQTLSATQRFSRHQGNAQIPIQMGKFSQSPQPHRQQSKSKTKRGKEINTEAILRAQGLIEQIKQEIIDGFSRRGSQDDGGGSAQEEHDRISHDPDVLLAQASSVLTFHPREQQMEREFVDQEEEVSPQPPAQQIRTSQTNASSQNLVSLLQRLQNELLDSIPSQQRRQTYTPGRKQLDQQPSLGLSARKLVQKRLDGNPSQYEEIEGSQERSPYVVRHMQVQRQNWIRMEDAKANQLQRLCAEPMQVGLADRLKKPQSAFLIDQNQQALKCSILDADVNVTNTSAIGIGDTSSNNVIQRPLPVNRIQQKITKDRTYGLGGEYQHRAPRPSPEKLMSTENMLREIYSPEKSSAQKNKVQGNKITGFGAGAGTGTGTVGADHTLTLIFDSDEEMGGDGGQPSERYYRHGDQKRLSEIVEDYLDEGSQIAQNDLNLKLKLADEDVQGQNNDGTFTEVDQEPFERAIEVSQQKAQEEGEQHSFMQESSLQNLFSHSNQRGPGGMKQLESGFEGTSIISRRDGGSSSRFTIGAVGTIPSGDNSKPRISDFNLPIAHVSKQDISHMSDDADLNFWLQQNSNGVQLQSQNSGGYSGTVIEPNHSHQKLEYSNDRIRSSATNKSVVGRDLMQQAQPSDRDLFEIKELIESGTPQGHRREPDPIAFTQTSQVASIAQTQPVQQISEAQKWAPPPKLKNLRSKKKRAQQQPAAVGSIFGTQPQNPAQILTTPDKPDQTDRLQKEQQQQPPLESDQQTRPGTFSNILPVPKAESQITMLRPMMQGSGTQAKNPKLTQTLMPPHQTSMEMQDVSHYSENFDEEDYMEQSNNSSSKQSVHKYLFQFFNPSAKLHMQEQQYVASQSAFRKSNVSSSMATPPQVERKATTQVPQPQAQQQMAQMMPSGLAAGIPRSSGKKSPHMPGRKTAVTQSQHPSGSTQ